MNNLNITVYGAAGSGKSTITSIINKCLREHGLAVQVIAVDDYLPDDLLERNLGKLTERNTKITITEVQTARMDSVLR